MNLVLASASPRRKELLANAGIPCVVRPANVEEILRPGESPQDYVRRLAREKAEGVPAHSGEVILGADTTVEIDGAILEKPADSADAIRMLSLLQGRSHQVHTGVCLVHKGRPVVDVSTTEVVFRPLEEREIREYIHSGEAMGKAGAYGIQGRASRFVERMEGCYFNVVGLPVSLVWRILQGLQRDTQVDR